MTRFLNLINEGEKCITYDYKYRSKKVFFEISELMFSVFRIANKNVTDHWSVFRGVDSGCIIKLNR